MREIDTRGLSCPQPVLLFHEAAKADAQSPMDILVDNEASRENVTRAATKLGWQVTQKDEESGVTRLLLRKE
ncbi:MAG: sulfurtransferase TusA family protein [Desulfovibrionaceae bacterium]|nr:sulfurtransferase TusA family protein [Desulfovibrionaceae bacterium]